MQAADTGRITHASANLAQFLDRSADQALGQPLVSVLGDDVATLIGAAAQARRTNPTATGLDAGLAGGRVRLMPFVSTGGAICIDILREPPPDLAEPALIKAQRVIQALRLSRTCTGLCGNSTALPAACCCRCPIAAAGRSSGSGVN